MDGASSKMRRPFAACRPSPEGEPINLDLRALPFMIITS